MSMVGSVSNSSQETVYKEGGGASAPKKATIEAEIIELQKAYGLLATKELALIKLMGEVMADSGKTREDALAAKTYVEQANEDVSKIHQAAANIGVIPEKSDKPPLSEAELIAFMQDCRRHYVFIKELEGKLGALSNPARVAQEEKKDKKDESQKPSGQVASPMYCDLGMCGAVLASGEEESSGESIPGQIPGQSEESCVIS